MESKFMLCRVSSLVMVVLISFAGAVAARAENHCPWLNEATASGFLGGDAVGAYIPAAAGEPAECTFTQHIENATRTLRITVEAAPDPHVRMAAIERSCGADAAPLNAIGNEALFCRADERKGRLGERAIGRVRDQIFTITLVSELKDDPVLTRDALEMRIYAAAEQVAGNLF